MNNQLEEIRKELEGTIYTNKDEIDVYVQLRSEGMAEVGAIEALNSFGIKELEAIVRFRRLYSHYFPNEQVERVEELQKHIKNYKQACESWEVINKYDREQNKRYREAFERVKLATESKTANPDTRIKTINGLVCRTLEESE